MAPKTLPSRDLVRQLLHYDAATGVFTWLPRPREMFTSRRQFLYWNGRYVGKPAGCTERYGYRVIHLDPKTYKAHRLAWLYIHDEPVPAEIDHIDGDKGNNRISNLRAATPGQNQANTGTSPLNFLGIKGVRAYKGSFRAHIRFDGIGMHLGTFKTVEEAAEAYQEAAVRLHGEFARWD